MKSLYFLLVFSFVLLVACNGNDSDDSDNVNLPLSLEGNQWQLISYGYEIDEKTEVLPDSLYTLTFSDEGDVSGWIDCNQFNSTYSVGNNEIVIEPFGVTEKGCPQMGNEAYESEVTFVSNALYLTQSYLLSNGQLVITASDSSQLIFTSVESL